MNYHSPAVPDLENLLMFSQHCAGKPIEGAVYCLTNNNWVIRLNDPRRVMYSSRKFEEKTKQGNFAAKEIACKPSHQGSFSANFSPVTQENKMVNHQIAQIRRLFLAFKRQVTIRKIGLCCIEIISFKRSKALIR